MKRFPSCLALWTLTAAANGQTVQLNVERQAYDYELIDIVSAADFSAEDRKIIAEFLAERQSAITRARGSACPELLDGKISIEEFAIRLDDAIDGMHWDVSAGYLRMRERLSWQGQDTLQEALGKVPLWSADTRAVDIVAVAPRAAESSFKDLCAGAAPPP